MSDVAFAEAEADETDLDLTDEGQDDADLEAQEGEEGEEGGEDKPKARDWEKVAHDKEGALAKERSKRRALERDMRELRSQVESLRATTKPGGDEDDALEALITSLRDDDDDPITDLAGIKKALKTFINQQKASREEEGKLTQQQQALRNLATTMAEYEADFQADHPDYPKAQAHYKQALRDELEEAGWGGQALERELASRLVGLAERAITAGRDPAEVVYGLAKKRGFAAGEETANEKLKKIAGAAEASRTPTGGKQKPQLTAAYVSTLKGAAFDKAFEQLEKQAKGR